MHHPLRTFLGLSAWLISAHFAQAELRLPKILSDHMVLQSGQPASMWGWCGKGENVKVVFLDEQGKEKATAKAVGDTNGRWSLPLPSLPPNLAGRVVVTTDHGEKKEITDVLTGEVWLGGGQSNMVYRVGSSGVVPETIKQAQEEATAAKNQIRYFMTTGEGTDTPQDDVTGDWVVAASDNVTKCSAVAWYFGVSLHEKLQEPIGLIVSAVGGTRVESWMPKAALDATSVAPAIWSHHREALAKVTPEMKQAFEKALAEWEKTSGKKGRQPPEPYSPTDKNVPDRLYNGMIAGLGTYTLKGILWYQADGNIHFPEQYGELIQALIKSWREQWKAELPFYYVEMNDMHEAQAQPLEKAKGFSIDEGMALLREQQNAALKLPKTGVASALGLGRVNNPTFNAHFPLKKPLGDRLANLVLKEIYNQPLGEVCSPEFESYTLDGGKIRLHFKHAKGLRATGDGSVKGFILRRPDGEWIWASGQVDGQDVLVWSSETPKPMEVRYAWASNPVISIENGAGLPLRPFRIEIKEFALGKNAAASSP